MKTQNTSSEASADRGAGAERLTVGSAFPFWSPTGNDLLWNLLKHLGYGSSRREAEESQIGAFGIFCANGLMVFLSSFLVNFDVVWFPER